MKNFILILFALAYFHQASAQYREETLLGDARRLGGFGAPYLTVSSVDAGWGGGGGVGGGAIINNSFVGAFVQAEMFGSRSYTDDDRYSLNLAAAGLWTGHVWRSHKLVHLFSALKMGVGVLNIDDPHTPNIDGDAVLYLQPEFGVEGNVLHWLRVSATLGYRAVSGVNQRASFGLQNSDFYSPTLSVVFRFGGFGYK